MLFWALMASGQIKPSDQPFDPAASSGIFKMPEIRATKNSNQIPDTTCTR
jgi:hypothetical protein